MIDIRTHITTIIAIFLALGVGIMIGVTVAPGAQNKIRDLLAQQKVAMNNVLAEHNHDKINIKNLESANGKIAALMVAGKLTGKNVAIVRIGDYADDVAAITEAVTDAGGTVTSSTVVNQRIQSLTPEESRRVRGEMASEPVSNDLVADLLHPLVKALVAGAAADSDTEGNLRALTSQRLIEVSGEYTKPISMVVIVGGYAATADDPNAPIIGTETALADMLKRRGITSVGCEPETAVSSSIPSFQKAGISTVDCTDHAVGRMDLIYALAGEAGDYGWKSTAARLLPESLDSNPPVIHPGGRTTR